MAAILNSPIMGWFRRAEKPRASSRRAAKPIAPTPLTEIAPSVPLACAPDAPEVDADRIGVWGTSNGGAHAPYVAGVDERVKAAVGQVGYGDGRRLIMDIRTPQERRELEALTAHEWPR